MTADTRPTDWMTPPEIVKELRIRESTPTGWIKAGLLPAVNLGTEKRPRYRVRRADLEAFLDKRAVVPPAKPARRQRTERTVPHYV